MFSQLCWWLYSEAGLKQQSKEAGCTAAEESEITQNADKAADAQGLPRTHVVQVLQMPPPP